jgi:hypothetical protein
MLLVNKSGTSLGLLPLTVLLTGVPGYVVLLVASAIGRGVAALARRLGA